MKVDSAFTPRGENPVSRPERGEGLCECGCGEPAPIAKRTDRSRGWIKGQPLRFIHGHNSFGVNRSTPRIKERWKVEDRGFSSPCWIWLLKTNRTGYGYESANGKDHLAHRRAYEKANGPIADGLHLDHLCRQRLCVNPDHLEPVTAFENTRRGRSSKLTPAQAWEIHNRRRNGETIRALAEEFGVSKELCRLLGKNAPSLPRRG